MYSARLLAEYQLQLSKGIYPFAERIYEDLKGKTLSVEELKMYFLSEYCVTDFFKDPEIISALQFLEGKGKVERIFNKDRLTHFRFLLSKKI